MLKKLLLPFLFLIAISANAQNNNSWIDYSKTYYKFKIVKDNITRIPQATLAAAGVGSPNADFFQLWKNGQQVRIYTSVTAAPLGSSDYIEFFGQMNDGKPDKVLYRQPSFQLADKYSLETDTSVYFLTINPAGGNLRYSNATNAAPSAATPEAYFMRNVDFAYRNKVNNGYAYNYNEYIWSSSYDNGEGLTTTDVASYYNNPSTLTLGDYTQTIDNLNVYSAAPANSLSVRTSLFCNSTGSRNISLKLNNNIVYPEAGTNGTKEYIINQTNLPLSYLPTTGSAALVATIKNLGTYSGTTAPPNERMVVASMGITYPATFNFNNTQSFDFTLAASATSNYLVIDNFNYGTTAPILYDINNGKRYIGEIASTSGKVKFVLPASTDPIRKFSLNSVENTNTVTALTSKTFVNYNTAATRGDYIIISHPALYNDGTGANPVDDYKNYRSSPNGGGFNAKVYDINELTDQFAFGIKGHPLAVKDFVRFMDAQYPTKPKFILLMGRGISYMERRSLDLQDPSTFATNLPLAAKMDFIPTFGWPPSDVLMVSPNIAVAPTAPVGRIGAISGQEIRNYLQKLIEYETQQRTPSPVIADKLWMKNYMQIVGGRELGEPELFKAFMDAYAAITGFYIPGSSTPAADTLFGSYTEQFVKTDAATIQQASSERIGQLFQEGLGLISYFGHSSATVFEFNLDAVQNYNNAGKYPFFNISGCLAGNYYTFEPQRITTPTTLSEKYIFTPQKGSIGFLADTHFGLPYNLHDYNSRFITNFSQLQYGKTVGEQIKETISYGDGGNLNLGYVPRMHLEEINLHGDPAIKINNFDKPDYVLEPQNVIVTPSVLTVANTFFTVKVKMYNIGRATKDSIKVYVKRLMPNGTLITLFDQLIPPIKNRDSFQINVPINPNTDAGLNKIQVYLDYTNLVPELYETNNGYSADVNIFQNSLNPIFPYEYAIINTSNINFVASTPNPLLEQSNFQLEVDTTELFNSPFKKVFNKTGTGGVVEFSNTSLPLVDSTVYYWRTAVIPNTGNPLWFNSSFTYLPASTAGFNMGHYFQFLKNTYNSIDLGPDRKFRYKPRVVSYSVKTAQYPTGNSPVQFAIVNNGYAEQYGLAAPLSNNSNALRFYVVDSINLKPWYNQIVGTGGLYGSLIPTMQGSNTRAGFFQFNISTAAARQVVKQFLDIIPNGNVVAMVNSGFGTNSFLPATWMSDPGSNLYQKLKSLGFNNIDSIINDVPYIFVARKGSGVVIKQIVASAITDIISTTFNLSGSDIAGTIISDAFGPAKKWNEIHWRGKSLDTPISDITAVDIIGLNVNGTEDSLGTVNPARDTTLNWVDASIYPKLKLRLINNDPVNATPQQLTYFRLNADLLPEGALAPNILFSMKDTVEAGEAINFAVAFKNISSVKFDSSMKFYMVIKNSSNVDNIIPIPRGKVLMVGDTLKVSYAIPSENYLGANTLFLDVNPNGHQQEEYHFNNILYKNFFVKADKINPLLDVTFDGVHILNRDIVSSKPDILIKLKDESKYLGLTDYNLLKVRLKYPDNTIKDYNFNTDTLRFTPANLAAGENTASINFKPILTQDGDYQLIVNGKDRSGNKAGAIDYNSVFTVINKPMISEMLNYPNPFTTSTAFVFTLTGSQLPQNIRIQILTITGKVVKEITKEELGPIHIGRNITSYKWDGTDMYNQPLANGVYIYRVLTNLNGNSLEKYKASGDDTDKYFNKGYGKMYLMR